MITLYQLVCAKQAMDQAERCETHFRASPIALPFDINGGQDSSVTSSMTMLTMKDGGGNSGILKRKQATQWTRHVICISFC